MLTGLRKGPRFLNRGEPLVPPVAPSLRAAAWINRFRSRLFVAGFCWLLAQSASRRAEPGSGGKWERAERVLTGLESDGDFTG
jgi:hypothetical protein